IDGFAVQADVQDHAATVALDSKSRDIYIRGKGKVELRGNYDVDATFDTSAISLQPLLAAYMPSQSGNVSGQTEIHARVRGPLKDDSLLDAHVTVPVLTMNYRNTVNLGAANPIQMDYTKGVLTIQPASIRGTGTELQIQGTIPVTGSAPAAI